VFENLTNGLPDIYVKRAKGWIEVCICYRIDGNNFEAAV
jgi:hypothetical protein